MNVLIKGIKLDKITVHNYKDGAEIEVIGNLNLHNIDNLHNDFQTILEKNPGIKIIGINCSAMESIDSSGFGMLISLSRQAEKTGITFYICELNKHVSALFDISHLDKFFHIINIQDFREIVQH